MTIPGMAAKWRRGAMVHGVSRSDLATERVEVGVVGDSGFPRYSNAGCCELRLHWTGTSSVAVCEGEDWITATLEAGANVRRLRTCLTCGYQFHHAVVA